MKVVGREHKRTPTPDATIPCHLPVPVMNATSTLMA